MAEIKNSGVAAEYDGSSGSTMSVSIPSCVVGDQIVLFQGIDWSWPSGSGNSLPNLSGTGITWTPRTIQYPTLHDQGFNVGWTGTVTSAGTRSITVASGSRDALINANWYHLDSEWSFHAAATTNAQGSASSGASPTIASCLANDHYFAAWQSGWSNANSWALPGSFTGIRHATGFDGTQSSGYEVLSSSGASGTRTATRAGSTTGWCATSVVMRPLAPAGPPPGQFTPFFNNFN